MADTMTDFKKAHGEVEAWLMSLGPHVDELSGQQLSADYPRRGFLAGWRLHVTFDRVRRLDLLLPIGFPWQPARVALVDAPPFLTWPHVEKDNLLCLEANNFEVNPEAPAGAAAYLLGKAEEMINDLAAGKRDADFRDEFVSYWDWAADKGTRIVSLLRPEPPTRLVVLWRGQSYYLVGESVEQLQKWLANRSGKAPDYFETVSACLVWLNEALVPREYPETADALRALLTERDAQAEALLNGLIRNQPDKAAVFIGANTANGPALAGVLVSAPKAQKYGARNPVIKGFRPGMIPEPVLVNRYFGGGAVVRRPIERADAGWVHGRGRDARARRLADTRVVLFGCGSLGAPIAISLAQSGVGQITLVDFDTLSWANTGRHPLGAGQVDQNKARALAEMLRVDFPHATFEFIVNDVDTVVRKHADVLEKANLIVAATGSWAAESRLDAWHASVGRNVPVLYTWMEAHAVAGHAVLLAGEQAILGDGFDGTGLPNFRATDWPGGPQALQEPACGAVYQPYGPIEAGAVSNLAGGLALEALLGEVVAPSYRLWIGTAKRLHELGGAWTPAWQADPQFREAGGYLAERAWQSTAKAQAA